MPTVGVISDTHGLLRGQVVEVLRGVDLIVHAGDVGAPEILPALAQLAPVFAVRGNVDQEPWAQSLPQSQVVEAGGLFLYVLHDLGQLDLDPNAAGFAVVISGHTHRPSVLARDGVLFLNPGSAGPRRFQLPVALATLSIQDGHPAARVIELTV